MINQMCLVGRLASDLEVKELENGIKMLNIVLAVPRSYKNADGVYETDFIKCSLWNNVAEHTATYCKKGDVVGIKGHVQSRKIENSKRSELEVVAERITFLSSSKEKEISNEMDM